MGSLPPSCSAHPRSHCASGLCAGLVTQPTSPPIVAGVATTHRSFLLLLITLARGGLVDVGTGELVIVLSGLNGKVPLEEMQNRPVVLLMNLKPAKVSTACCLAL
jgi:hypothetical protein